MLTPKPGYLLTEVYQPGTEGDEPGHARNQTVCSGRNRLPHLQLQRMPATEGTGSP